MIVIPSREMEPGPQNFPSSYPVPAVQGGGGGWISLRLHSTDTALLCPHLSPGAKTLLAKTRVCSVGEQHIQANHVLSPLYQGHTCLKIQSRLVLPSIVYLLLGKSHPRLAIKHWVLSMSSPGELKCEVFQNMSQDNNVFSRTVRKVVIQASVEQWLPSLSAIDLAAA